MDFHVFNLTGGYDITIIFVLRLRRELIRQTTKLLDHDTFACTPPLIKDGNGKYPSL